MAYSILCIDDDAEFLLNLKIQLKDNYQVLTAQSLDEAQKIIAMESIDMILLDVSLGHENGIEGLKEFKASHDDIDVVMISGHKDPQLIVQAIRAGASDYLCKPFAFDELLAVIEKTQKLKGMRERHSALLADLNVGQSRAKIIGESKQFKDMLEKISCVKGHQANVLLEGESGTGKELVARYVHNLENNSSRPFIAVNCAAIPDTLIESELFGHERGAFTGASRRKIGKFELANGGDIFLDEINSLKPELQAKILRVIQEQELYRVGGTKPIKISFRVIAATNTDLENMVHTGQFRMDLYHRLRVLSFKIPPLRERQDDIPMLVDAFVKKHGNGKANKDVSPAVIEAFKKYAWPGNVRELENLMHSLIIMSPTPVIRLEDLPQWINNTAVNGHAVNGSNSANISMSDIFERNSKTGDIVSLKKFIQMAEKDYIKRVMTMKEGDKNSTAKVLGISRSSLYEKIRSLH